MYNAGAAYGESSRSRQSGFTPSALARSGLSGTNASDFTRLEKGKRSENFGDQRSQVNHPIRLGPNDHDTQRRIPRGLLALKVAVHRDQGIKSATGSEQQLPVSQT